MWRSLLLHQATTMIRLDLPLSLALISLTLQIATVIATLMIARAPGWGRVRIFGVVAFTAAMYSACDVFGSFSAHDIAGLAGVIRFNLTVGAAHASAWLWYTYSDAEGRWNSLSPRMRALAVGNLLIVAVASALGWTVSPTGTSRLHVASLGIDMVQPLLSPVGNALAAATVFTLAVSLAEYVRRARRGDGNALCISIGFSLFGIFAIEEALVAAGVIDFIYLADIGYICVVAPVTFSLFRRFASHARRLAEMSTQLAEQVRERTNERDEAREALVEQQRLAALSALAGGVGHEINNPLQYLLFSLEELRARAGPMSGAHADESLVNALEGADRIRRAVDGLRMYSRPASETFAAVDVQDVIRTAVRIGTPQLGGAKVVTEFTQVLPVHGDEGKLVQIVVNLLVNCAQALATTPRRATPTIHVRTRMRDDGMVELEITDNGPGFASDVLPRLGEPYVTSRSNTGAIGLGLFVTRGVVDAHSGVLSLGNGAQGGAVVRVRLPASTERAVAPVRASVEARVVVPDQKWRVLLVDDDAPVLRTLARGLERRGYAVTTASDGNEALSLASLWPFDVVVSDLMMPGMSGIELAAALAEHHPELRRRMIVITGGAVTPAAEAFVQHAGVPVLGKPVEIATLRDAIERCILN